MMEKKEKRHYLIPGIAGWFIILAAVLLWAYWGTGEVFHEGWQPPYVYIIFYYIPFLIVLGIAAICIYFPLAGGILIMGAGFFYIVYNFIMSGRQHTGIQLSFWIIPAVTITPGILFLADYILKKKHNYREARKSIFKNKWKMLAIVILSFILIMAVGTPLLVRNLGRSPLKDYEEITVQGNGIILTFAGKGPGWYYSNLEPFEFNGKIYSALSWNEIAQFGKEPVGFEDKRYGPDYDGSSESIYFASQQDFDRYNMFRYLNSEGTELTEEIWDCWRLPYADDYARVFMYRGENSGGYFNSRDGKAYYDKTPDKEGPIWAPDKMVIYYWTSESYDRESAYDITYSGVVRRIKKITRQDYRGWRAVKTRY